MGHKKYTFLSNIAFSLRFNWRASKAACLLGALGTLARIAAPFAAIYLPKIVIDAITQSLSPALFISRVGLGALLLVTLMFLQRFTDARIDDEFGMIGSGYSADILVLKKLDMDFDLLTAPETKAAEDKAETAGQSNHTLANNLPKYLSGVVKQVGGFLLYGTVISTVHPAIIPLLAISAVISYLMLRRSRKYEEKSRDERSDAERKVWYLMNALGDPALAKDFRLYGMLGWLREKKNVLLGRYLLLADKAEVKSMQASLVSAAVVLVRDGAAYAFLIFMVLFRDLPLGDFVLMFAAIGAFADWVQGIIVQWTDLRRSAVQIADLRAYLDLPDFMNRGEGKPIPQSGAPEITLEQVCFTYPGAERETLHDINITLKPGERLAVVGVNGAGKSTLVKIICGLSRPTSGRVLLNGVDITEYNRDEYYRLFSAVFQEILTQPSSIAVNVSQSALAETDRAKVERCLDLAGLLGKIKTLPRGIDETLVRSVEPEAIELSGGERQKLALARALYKDSLVIMLDEPTAALDPIAESKMYEKYAELTAGRTSVYISHRLASTKFCDRIVLLDSCVLAEIGTHDELIALGGKYAGMFEVQASYYRSSADEAGSTEDNAEEVIIDE